MAARLKLHYDREADILYIDTREPYAEQISDKLGDEVVARRNPDTHDIETLEVLWFSTRLLRGELLDLPITATLRAAS
jgi:hypothetical protein